MIGKSWVSVTEERDEKMVAMEMLRVMDLMKREFRGIAGRVWLVLQVFG